MNYLLNFIFYYAMKILLRRARKINNNTKQSKCFFACNRKRNKKQSLRGTSFSLQRTVINSKQQKFTFNFLKEGLMSCWKWILPSHPLTIWNTMRWFVNCGIKERWKKITKVKNVMLKSSNFICKLCLKWGCYIISVAVIVWLWFILKNAKKFIKSNSEKGIQTIYTPWIKLALLWWDLVSIIKHSVYQKDV